MAEKDIPYLPYRELVKELHKQDFVLQELGDHTGVRVHKAGTDQTPLTIHRNSIGSEGPIYRSLISTLKGMGFIAPAERKKLELKAKGKVAPEGFDPQCPYCSRKGFKLPLHKMRHVKSAHKLEYYRDHPEELPPEEEQAKPKEPKAPRGKSGPVRVRQQQPESVAHRIKLLVRQVATAYRTIDTAMPEIIRLSEELEEDNKKLKARIDKYEEEWTRMIDRLPRG